MDQRGPNFVQMTECVAKRNSREQLNQFRSKSSHLKAVVIFLEYSLKSLWRLFLFLKSVRTRTSNGNRRRWRFPFEQHNP